MKRNWVDIAKGIGIILMVIGHTSIPEWLSMWIYSFHMPLFFILSGAFTNWERPITTFIKHKTKSLFPLFFTYSCLCFALLQFSPKIYNQNNLSYLLLNGWEGFALWFIPILLLSLLLTRCIPNKTDLLAITLLSALAYWLCYERINIPWSLSSLPIATVFILIGRNLKFLKNLSLEIITIKKILILAILFFTCSTLISLWHTLDIANNKILPFIPTILASFTGTFFIAFTSLIITRTRFLKSILTNIGRNTFEILSFSQVLIIIQGTYLYPSILKYIIMTVGILAITSLRSFIFNKHQSYNVFSKKIKH